MTDVKDRPEASADAELILKLQDKLDSLKNQVHSWTAKAKVFEQNGSYNFDQFTKTLSSSPRNTSSAKSKPLGRGKKDWQALSLAQQYEILHHVANEHTRVTLNFEALSMALKTSLASTSMKSAFSLQKGDENVSDPEERGYLLELLEEQNERSQAIIKAEDHRLSKEIKLLDLKCELAHEFDSLKKQYAVLLDGPPDMASPAPKRKALASVDEQNRTDEMKHNLEVEEKRANQMKLLIQKLLMADVSGCLNVEDEEMRERREAMFIKCGEDLSLLRKDKKEVLE